MTDQPTPADPRDDATARDDTTPTDATPTDATQPIMTDTETWAPTPPPAPAASGPIERPAWTLEPSRVSAAPPAVVPSERRGGTGFGQVLAAAILSAVLASGGTVLVLQGTGQLDATPGAAPTATNPPALGSPGPGPIDESNAVVEAAARVSPAVVRIIAEGVGTDVFGGTIPERGVGSGVIYDANGWILTNRHVVVNESGATASRLTVELKDGREFTGTVYGIDTLTDLAIVKVDASGLPSAPIGRSSDIQVGQLAIAIGSPLGTYTSTVTTGIISATGRSILVEAGVRLNNLIQTDAAINPGNSGGPLLDATGAVVGINTAVERDSTGIGFAIPIDIARPIMLQALTGEPLARPYLGIRYQAIDAKLQRDENLDVDHGALIGPSTDSSGATHPAITAGSPADAAGLRDGDIVLSIEDQVVDTEHPLDAILTSYAPGDTVTMTVLRGSEELRISITLGTRPEGL